MPRYPLIGIGAGLATALLIASTATGGLAIRLFVYLLAPLPLVLAGLGLGSVTAAIGGITSTLVLLAIGPKVAALHLTSTVIPVVILSHLALLSRPQPAAAAITPPAGPALEWFRLGRLVAAAAVLAGFHGVISTVVLGIDLDQQRKMLRSLMQVFSDRLPRPEGKTLTEDDITALVEMGVYTLPAAAALTWLLGMLLNFYIGARITAAAGQLARPLPDVPSMIYPAGFGLGLAAALPLAFAGGTLGFVGAAFAGGLFCAQLLMGLAIIHDISRRTSARPAILTALYVALVILNSWTAVALALLAALAPILRLKRGNAPAAANRD